MPFAATSSAADVLASGEDFRTRKVAVPCRLDDCVGCSEQLMIFYIYYHQFIIREVACNRGLAIIAYCTIFRAAWSNCWTGGRF
jgi:hypothetical protein